VYSNNSATTHCYQIKGKQMAKVLSKPATATATVVKVASAFTGYTTAMASNKIAYLNTQPSALKNWVASVGGANNVVFAPTQWAKNHIASAPQPGVNVLPYGYGGKAWHVRAMQINWLLYGIAPNWATHHAAAMLLQSNPARSNHALAHIKCGAQLAKGKTPVFTLHAYQQVSGLTGASWGGGTVGPCVILAMLNGGIANKFAQRSPSAGTPAITLQVAKPTS
jgi:hypothetical protein